MAGDRRAAYVALIDAQNAIMEVFLEIKNKELETEEGRAWIIKLTKKGKA